jgi:Uncharacterized protein conserved in bacteria (DUF2130)
MFVFDGANQLHSLEATMSEYVTRGTNGRARLLRESTLAICPTCERPFTDTEQATRVHARHEAQERARAEDFKRHQRELEERARAEGMEVARAATKGQIETLVADNARLKANMETAVAKQTDQRVAADRQAMAADRQGYVARVAEQTQLITKLTDQLATVERKLKNQPSQELGEVGEEEIVRRLKEALPDDSISRVAKGVNGADIVLDIVHRRKVVARILVEVKNTRGSFQSEWPVKLAQDRIAAKAQCALLVSNKLPAGSDGHIHFSDSVIVVNPDRVVAVVRILRRMLSALARKGENGTDMAPRMTKVFELFTTGKGRQLIEAATGAIPKLRQLDEKILNAAKTHAKDSEKVLTAQEGNLADIFAAIDEILEEDEE